MCQHQQKLLQAHRFLFYHAISIQAEVTSCILTNEMTETNKGAREVIVSKNDIVLLRLWYRT